jgi:hypothetical protein
MSLQKLKYSYFSLCLELFYYVLAVKNNRRRLSGSSQPTDPNKKVGDVSQVLSMSGPEFSYVS